ncbi:putative alpha-2B adrenergic receptor-like [Scophthalmus maximus]|uniref:Alpha-2B adrenergic receptor n=1 Tax=Scophthalmus maximus TaxID=52904 RepID=A0A2U9CIW6_SCOMX|nr:putative alpha-2B adrenergic receptor-like [Scophthalmus maximus]
MAAAPDVPCLSELSGVHGRNISFVSSTRPCNQSAARTPPPYSPQATAAFAVAITFMMMVTIVGNILVIIAVLTSRSLKGPQNLFLVSLAAADILVATLIIPFSLANELQGYWAFSSVWCEIYLALDVLFCTSSIVHLCAVALDRYLSISRPVSYGARRTPSRIKAGIIVVWLISAVISFPPLLTLDKSDGGEEVCELNNERWYILYSTVGSFFAPCVIMILVYVRIYQIAKRHTRCSHGQKQKTTAGGNAGVATRKVREQSPPNEDQGGTTSSRREKTLNKTSSLDSTTSSLQKPPESTASQSSQRRPPRSSSIPPGDSQILSAVPDKASQKHPDEGGGALADNTSSSEMEMGGEGFPREGDKGEKSKGEKETVELSQSKGARVQALHLVSRHKSTAITSSGTKLVPEGTPASRRKALVNREKRFTFVLAVVMGVFVICWFPFFLSYSLKAVCPETCSIPDPLFKFFFWIGYCNSCLNPVIYTIFNKDFRKAFKRILCRDTKGTFF